MSRLEMLLVAVLALFASYGVGWAIGHSDGKAVIQADWDRDKLARVQHEKLAIQEAVAKNEADRQKDLADTRAVLTEQQRKNREDNDRITAERAAADRDRLRITIPRTNCPAPAGAAAGAIIADGARDVEQVELPGEVERGLRDLAEDADREIARLKAKIAALQDWLKSHGFADAEP
jgi:hypothetical protein